MWHNLVHSSLWSNGWHPPRWKTSQEISWISNKCSDALAEFIDACTPRGRPQTAINLQCVLPPFLVFFRFNLKQFSARLLALSYLYPSGYCEMHGCICSCHMHRMSQIVQMSQIWWEADIVSLRIVWCLTVESDAHCLTYKVAQIAQTALHVTDINNLSVSSRDACSISACLFCRCVCLRDVTLQRWQLTL